MGVEGTSRQSELQPSPLPPWDGISKPRPRRGSREEAHAFHQDCLISSFALLEISSLRAQDCSNVGF